MYLFLKSSYIFVPLFRIQYLRSEAEAKAPVLSPPDTKSQLTGKDPDAGKDWGQEKRGTEDEMVRWYHQLNEHWVWANSVWEIVKDREAWHAAVHGVPESETT